MAGLARGERLRSASQSVAPSGSSRSSASSSGSTGILGAAAHRTSARTLSGQASAASIATSAPIEWPTSTERAEAERAASSPTASR